MKSLAWNGNQLELVERPVPSIVENEALVRVTIAGVCGTDLEILRGYADFRGILGHEFVGRVVECSSPEWIGERVVADINVACGECERCRGGLSKHCSRRQVLGLRGRDGAFAEYVAAPVQNLHRVPDEVSDEEAVFAEPLAAAFRIAEQVTVSPAMRCALLGDGQLGFLTAQVLRAVEVAPVVVGHHAQKLRLFTAQGFEAVLESDLRAQGSMAARDFDLVIDCTGSSGALETALKLVRPQGCIVLKSTCAEEQAVSLTRVVVDEVTLIGSRCGPIDRALQALANDEVQVGCLVEEVFPLTDGLAAIQCAMRGDTMKVLIRAGR